jgi:predicted nucleic acid-binding protein
MIWPVPSPYGGAVLTLRTKLIASGIALMQMLPMFVPLAGLFCDLPRGRQRLERSHQARPSAQVIDWLGANERELAVAPIILGEVRFGIHLLPAGKSRRRLERWFEQGAGSLLCLPWDAVTGLPWAELLADLRRAGLAMSVKDSMIAATALVHRLTVATRNQKDFRKAGVPVFDPFA